MNKFKQILTRRHFYLLLIFTMLVIISCKSDDLSDAVQIDRSGKIHPWTNLEWNNNPENFQFAIVSDRTGGNRPGVFEQAIEKFNLLQPEFVMSVGDLIDGYSEDTSKINSQWDEFDKFVSGLQMPFFYVPGNHDLTNQVQADIWKERLGPTYYHFVYRDVLFLALNGEEGFDAHRTSFYSEEQKEFVRKALADNQNVRWTLVFMHKPIWDYEEKSKESGWLEIELMLKERKHTVFAGHNHSYKHFKRNNSNNYIRLATTGGGSALGGPMTGQFDHIVWVTMTENGPIITNLMLEGIWDEDFSADDIQKYLELTLKDQAVIAVTKFDEKNILNGDRIEYRVFNKYDIPMKVSLSFDKGDFTSVRPLNIEQEISPNSVEIIGAKIRIKKNDAADEEIVDDINSLKVHYEITYNFKEYGEVLVQGSIYLYK